MITVIQVAVYLLLVMVLAILVLPIEDEDPIKAITEPIKIPEEHTAQVNTEVEDACR